MSRPPTDAPAILGIGTALPPRAWTREEGLALAQARSAATAAQARHLAVLYQRARVGRRFLVADERLYPPADEPTTALRMTWYAEHAGPLAARACSAALADAQAPAGEISHLVTVSCTGFAAPGVEFELLRRLELAPSVQRAHIGFMGCHGLLNGLGVARAFAAAPGARVLLCAVELCSLHMRYGWDPDRLVPNALFGDGAAALVVGAAREPEPEPEPGRDGVRERAHDQRHDVPVAPARGPARYAIAATASRLLPDSDDVMSWRIGSHGFEMTLSARVPDLIAGHVRPWLTAWLDGHGIALGAVGSWAVHPGGPRVLDAVAGALGLPRAATAVSRAVLDECGNMSSATVGFVLERMARQRAAGPVVALAFGPGLVAEAALLVGA